MRELFLKYQIISDKMLKFPEAFPAFSPEFLNRDCSSVFD